MIVETFKLNKNYIKNIDDNDSLNDYLKTQLEDNLWKLNEIIKLIYIYRDSNYDNICSLFQIDKNILKQIKDIYFINNIDIILPNNNVVFPVKRYKRKF